MKIKNKFRDIIIILISLLSIYVVVNNIVNGLDSPSHFNSAGSRTDGNMIILIVAVIFFFNSVRNLFM